MQISLSKVRIYSRLSEETICYDAVVCIYGKPAFHASNRGTGESDRFEPLGPGVRGTFSAQMKAVEAFIATLPPYRTGGYELAMTLELFVGLLRDAHQREQERVKFERKIARGSHLYLIRAGKLFTIKRRSSAPVTPAEVASIGTRNGGQILNLAPNAWELASAILYPVPQESEGAARNADSPAQP